MAPGEKQGGGWLRLHQEIGRGVPVTCGEDMPCRPRETLFHKNANDKGNQWVFHATFMLICH